MGGGDDWTVVVVMVAASSTGMVFCAQNLIASAAVPTVLRRLWSKDWEPPGVACCTSMVSSMGVEAMSPDAHFSSTEQDEARSARLQACVLAVSRRPGVNSEQFRSKRWNMDTTGSSARRRPTGGASGMNDAAGCDSHIAAFEWRCGGAL
jgi:hypothetical protein